MKEYETIEEYSNRLFGIVNKVRLLDTEFADSRIVQKMLVTTPGNYEAFITTLENTKDLSQITLVNALQAQKQQRLMRQDHIVEGALPAKYLDVEKNKKKFNRKKNKLQVVKTQQIARSKARVEIKKKHRCWKKWPSPIQMLEETRCKVHQV